MLITRTLMLFNVKNPVGLGDCYIKHYYAFLCLKHYNIHHPHFLFSCFSLLYTHSVFIFTTSSLYKIQHTLATSSVFCLDIDCKQQGSVLTLTSDLEAQRGHAACSSRRATQSQLHHRFWCATKRGLSPCRFWEPGAIWAARLYSPPASSPRRLLFFPFHSPLPSKQNWTCLEGQIAVFCFSSSLKWSLSSCV